MAKLAEPSSTPPLRVFPTAGTALAKVICDRAYRDEFHARLASMNRYVVALYRIGLLPLLGVGKTIRGCGRSRALRLSPPFPQLGLIASGV